jgi:hypothetical protein
MTLLKFSSRVYTLFMDIYSVYWGNANNPYPVGSMKQLPKENALRLFETMKTSVFEWVLVLDEHNMKIVSEHNVSKSTKHYLGT